MKKVILFIILSVFFLDASAIPANSKPVKITQPDGSALTIVLHGDEFLNYTTTTDGYTVMLNESNGAWEYAVKDGRGQLCPGGIQAPVCQALLFLQGFPRHSYSQSLPVRLRLLPRTSS